MSFINSFFKWASQQENVILLQANDKNADQTVRKHSLISAFVIQSLESMIDKLATTNLRERSGSVVEHLTRDRRVRASLVSLRCGPGARHIYLSLVLVRPRKTRPYLTERLLMGQRIESIKQTSKQI